MKKIFNYEIIVTRLNPYGKPVYSPYRDCQNCIQITPCINPSYNPYRDCQNCIQNKLKIDKDLWANQHLSDISSPPFVVTYEEMVADFEMQRSVSNSIKNDLRNGPTSVMRRAVWEAMQEACNKKLDPEVIFYENNQAQASEKTEN